MPFFQQSLLKAKKALPDYFKVSIPILFVFYFLRIFEFFTSALKLDLKASLWILELKILALDTLFWLHLSAFLFIPFILCFFFSSRVAKWLLFAINSLIILIYFSLLVVFTERLSPFDHEVFMRTPSEAISTVTTEIGGKLIMVSPLVLFLLAYFFVYRYALLKRQIRPIVALAHILLAFASLFALNHSRLDLKDCKGTTDYHLTTNKLRYFVSDCYDYLMLKRKINLNGMDPMEIARQIAFYHEINKHPYTSDEFPLLREDDSKNVLADFLNIKDSVPPNIVILIYEGLSSDFSGRNAPSGSFTPFLDSLAERSLSWYNCLSSAQGTFGSLPAITGSLPFGERGFTLLLDPPDHLSMIKILKKNNWQTNFMVGADPNFDNFAGFCRMQGIDHVTSFYGKKYRKMGVDASNWTIGYPDKALFNKSFEDLDSIRRAPYLSVYLTLTTHTPFIFDELHQYEKKFDKVMDKRKLPLNKRLQMNIYRQMFASYLYTDDCMRDFFEKYKKRPEYKNTIFVITGDHHHGFFPTRNAIDDYNVPLIIYSPLLKKAVNFQSVNSHFNIAPTLMSLLKNSYHLKETPKNVTWIGDVLDTCRTFRNIHHLPFILSNRNIEDFIYEDYYLADGLYKLEPGLNLKSVDDPKQLERMTKIRENFKLMNAYVCQKNKLFPFSMNSFDKKKTALYEFKLNKEEHISKQKDSVEYIHEYRPPVQYKRIMVRVSFELKYQIDNLEELPRVCVNLYDAQNKRKVFTQIKDARDHIPNDPKKGNWIKYAEEDVYDLNTLGTKGGNVFRFTIENPSLIDFSVKDLSVEYFGMD